MASAVSWIIESFFPVLPALHRRPWFLCLLLICNGVDQAVAAQEALHPNVRDAATLHLWHVDEDKPPFADDVEKGTPLLGLLNGARAGQAALPGFGKSVSLNAKVGGTPGLSDLRGAILLAQPVLESGPRDNVPAGFSYFGPDGAFTFEMVVKFDVLPKDSPNIAMDLLTMEGDGADRIFNLRLEKEGFLVFVPLPHCGASGGAIASIPTKGPNAPDTKSWFHVAVTYDGNGGVANNLKLYWTRIVDGVAAANGIGSGTLSNDLNGLTGDLAVGNEARGFFQNAEAEPFQGCIDEVRISGVARHATDFFFVPAGSRLDSTSVGPDVSKAVAPRPLLKLDLANVLVDSASKWIPAGAGRELVLGAGLHRLDFDFGFHPVQLDSPQQRDYSLSAASIKLRCQLEGIDDQWQETEVGMGLVCQSLDDDGRVISQSRFPIVGRSDGWKTSLEDSVMTRRTEPLYIPADAKKLKIILSSGSPDTTGFFVVDYFGLQGAGNASPSLLENGVFTYDAHTTSPAGTPAGWRRNGGDPAIARMILRSDRPGIGLVDGDQSQFGDWTSVQTLAPSVRRGRTYTLTWYEAYNVIRGSSHRATYINVPPGKYTFRAIGLADTGETVTDDLSLAVTIRPPFWERFWFWPAVTAASVALVAALIFIRHRQRAKRALERLRFQNALEKDRTRIARDMHDDLGSRVTFINMSAALAQRDIEKAPDNARRHLLKMTGAARDLIVAMDDLVWAVDPTHDTLDHLGSHLARMAEELFRDTPIRVRLDIPLLLPALPLGSEFRHHIALAVKESFHNVLCHAGPCEVFFALAFNGDEIRITIRDTGVGFDPATDERGHGLDNLASRFHEIGGTCKITSSPGAGTCIVLSSRVDQAHHPKL